MSKPKRRKSRNFGYYIREGFKGIASHGFMSFAAITIMAACLLITGSFSLVALNIDHVLEQLMSENEFLAYVDETLSDEEAAAIQSELEVLDNVAEVQFITRQEAKDNYLAGINADDDLYSSLPSTVLRHRYSIRVDDISILAETLEQVEGVSGIAETNAALDVAEGFVTVRNAVTIVTVGLVGVLLIISLFIISNAIKLATLSRQEEIAIMKMCGATNGFIRAPFVVEGMVLGLSSAIIGFALQWGLYSLLLKAISGYSRMQLLSMIPFEQVAPFLGAAFAAVGLIVGVFGSLMTIRKYLQV